MAVEKIGVELLPLIGDHSEGKMLCDELPAAGSHGAALRGRHSHDGCHSLAEGGDIADGYEETCAAVKHGF